PEWIKDSDFYSVTRTQDELSIVCKQSDSITEESAINTDWRIIKIQGALDFSLVGIIAEVAGLLEKIKISIITISTYDTDYILLKNQDLGKAVDSLKSNGHIVNFEN
ncbi:MAG: ACT domain-containing protein, partial [Bacteroidota bacterium]